MDIGITAAHIAQVVAALLLVVVVIIGSALFMRRIGGLQSRLGSELRIITGLSLGARERLLLVQVGDKQLLIGVTPGCMRTLYVLEQPILTHSSTQQSPQDAEHNTDDTPFARKLRSLLQRST